MKIYLLLCLLLTGCASQYWAGVSRYEVTPILNKDNVVIGCCILSVYSGKEAQSVHATFSKTGNDYRVTLDEKDVRAFPGQQISSGTAASVAASTATAVVDSLKSIK